MKTKTFDQPPNDLCISWLAIRFESTLPSQASLTRLVAILHGEESIKDYIAFPKNNSGKDVMIDAPSKLDDMQLNELSLKLKSSK